MTTEKLNIKIKPLPYLRIFLIVFIIINLIGIINFPFYKDKIDNNELYLLIVLGFTGFLIGTLYIRLLNFKISPSKGRLKVGLLKSAFLLSNAISFVLIAYTHYINRGIIILMGNARFTNYSVITLMVYIAIILTMIYMTNIMVSNKKIKLRHLIFIAFQSISVLSLGYRSPLIILVVGFAIIFIIVRNDYQNKYKNIFTFKKVFYFLTLIALMSAISSYRVASTYNIEKFFRNIDFEYLDDYPYLKPFMSTLAVFRYDQEVVKIIIRKTKNNPYYGELAISNFLTLLPGEQLGVRNIVGDVVNARKQPDGKPWSITPTLQGALFMDGGFLGVIIGFFLLGAVLEFLKKIAVIKKDPFSIVIYALLAINSLMIIHTGYFDVTFFILLIFIIILKILLTRISFKLAA